MGTQTSKPLFGDEERRNRFRRARSPTNITNSTTSSSTSTSAASGVGDSNNNNKRTWPCSNCHATVSNDEKRCPYCGGIQVKVKIPRSPLSTTKALNSNLLLERLTTPTTPVARKEIDSGKIQAFLTESATTSTMDYEDEDEEVEDNNNNNRPGPSSSSSPFAALDESNRPASALSQASSLSQNFNIPIQQQQQLPSAPPFTPSTSSDSPVPFFSSPADRPPDPVALTLEAVPVRGSPSPLQQQQVGFEPVHPRPQQPQQPQQSALLFTKRKAGGPSSGFQVPKKRIASSSS